MVRTILSHRQWRRLQALLPSEEGHHGRPYSQSHRLTMEGILWVARTGAPWRDLPSCFGKWGSVYQRFNRWTQRGIFLVVFQNLLRELRWGVVLIDGTFIKAHPHAAGAPKEDAHRSRHNKRRLWAGAKVG